MEQVRQRLERSDGSLEVERRVFHAFLNIEEVIRYRHMLLVLQLDDISDDLIPNKVAELLVLPFREHLSQRMFNCLINRSYVLLLN